MLLFSHAFQRGGTVAVLYPIYASTFIWAAVMAWAIYGQPIRPVHVGGMILLVVGIVCMSAGK
jgi:multidrug transporter EmrE-like cation transporter